MRFKTPFYAVMKAVNRALQENESGTEWFDGSAEIPEIESFFQDQSEFSYGIIGASEADTIPNMDMEIWEMTVELEVYSNYKGKKVIAQTLEALLNYLCTKKAWILLQTELKEEKFQLVDMHVGKLRINLPIFSDKGTWQSGGTNVTFRVGHIKDKKKEV